MTNIISPGLASLLTDCDLAEYTLTQNGSEMSLTFTWSGFVGGEGHDVTFLLHNVVYLQTWRPMELDGAYFVGIVTVSMLGEDGIIRIPQRDAVQEVKIHTSFRPLYHLHIDGRIGIDAIAEQIEILDDVLRDSTS